jgi:Flp pilus assembly protein TadB
MVTRRTRRWQRLSERIDLPDLRYLKVAVQIHGGAGDELADALDDLARMLRNRLRMLRKPSATTTETQVNCTLR